MKELEALERVESVIEMADDSCDLNTAVGRNLEEAILRINDDMKLIKQALTEYEVLKQRDTAMKIGVRTQPFYDYDSGDNIDHQPSMSYEVAICEACNTDIGRTGDNFCPNCGQRLEWRE
jgi:rRNA maturation endonuclease Nob1